ncbi:MAG: hypothetical protein LUI87_09615 [Lachnospiraceae bacterium]|nr:hypothetical protein [Lachnospiraceae bacterium]
MEGTGKNQSKGNHQAKGFGQTGGDIWDDDFWDDLLSDIDLSSGGSSTKGTGSYSGNGTWEYPGKTGASSGRSTGVSSVRSTGTSSGRSTGASSGRSAGAYSYGSRSTGARTSADAAAQASARRKKKRRRKTYTLLKRLLVLIVAVAAICIANLRFHFVDDIREVPTLAWNLVSEVPGAISEVPKLAQKLASNVSEQAQNLVSETAEKLGISQERENEDSAEELITADSSTADSAATDSAAADSASADSAAADSASADSAAVGSASADSALAGSTSTDSAQADSADGSVSESYVSSGEIIAGESVERSPDAAQSTVAAAIWEETVSAVAELTDLSVIPGLEDDATEENLLALLYAYDLDGAFFLNYALNQEQDFMCYFYGGDAVQNVSTAVHEMCHHFTTANAGEFVDGVTRFRNGKAQSVYVGEGYSLDMDFTDVYESQEMIEMIPEELRTFRFSTYVGEPDENLASNVEGIYGLLDEFTAYCWGTSTCVSLFNYYKTQEQTPETWLAYVSNCSTSSAYAEFRYYILTYLLYAASNHSDVYDEIMENENFVSAFCWIDDKYQEVIAIHEANLDEIERIMTDAGYDVTNERDVYFIGLNGVGTNLEDYDLLMDFMESDEDYMAMYERLRG